MQSKSTRKPTIAEQQRFQAIKEVGCTPCWLEGRSFEPCDIQHVVKGRKRLGHEWTYGCCPWHHRGLVTYPADTKMMEHVVGPSLARSPKDYHAKYGSEEELVDLCNKMIEPYLQAWRGEFS